MAYRLRKDEPVSKGLRRIVKQELRSAIDQLAGAQPSDDAVHEARKSIKKVRAVLQLVGEDIDAGRALKRLRRAGHLLSPLRDADAVIGSAHALCARERTALSAKTCAALRDMLKHEKARLSGAARRNQVKERTAQTLRHVKRTAKDWDWNNVGFSVLAAEIRRSYKRARRAMRQARGRNRAETFHEWRKRVKTLWYALRLLERRVPPLRRELTDLEHLQTWLGDDHNLLVLRTKAVTSRPIREKAGSARVKRLAARKQQQLRRMALAKGARVFKDTPKAFVGHLKQAWQKQGNSRRGSRRGHTKSGRRRTSLNRTSRNAA